MASITVSFQTFISESGPGTTAWSSPGNAQSSDDSKATMTLGGSGISAYLKATNRTGAAIPSGATIDSFELKYECMQVAAAKDHTVKMVKGGTVQGNNLADTSVNWGVSDTTQTRSKTVADTGLTFTPADVNATDFGFAVACQRVGGTTPTLVGQVDYMSMVIHYTEAAAGGGAKSQCVIC